MNPSNTNRSSRAVVAFIVPLVALPLMGGGAAWADDLPDHPRNIVYDDLIFEPPAPEDFRHELSDGTPVYMAVSNEFPLVTITFSFKGGQYMEPDGFAGLAATTGAMMRQGGTETLPPKEFDEEVDFLAANISSSVGATTSGASINTLTANLDRAFDLFLDMVRNPGFDESRLNILRNQQLEAIKARNDNGQQIVFRELNNLMWGEDHFESRQPTRASLEAITPEAMRDLHARIFHPGNLMIAVTGDFEPESMLAMLEEKLAGWTPGPTAPEVPVPKHEATPGVYYYEKDQNQVQVFVGHRGIQRDDPDAIDVEVMNQILGGSGFTSRITNRVRTQEGLAYSAGSVFSNRVDYPGFFVSYFFTNPSTTALATRLVFDEIRNIKTQTVSDAELETIKNSLIETFPRNFESKAGMMSLFINDERTGRDRDYWRTYRDRVRAVTADDVQRAANERLRPDDAVIVVVGPWEQISRGNLASEADPNRQVDMSAFGTPTALPARDPESLKPIK